MSFNAIRENKILAKISEFTVKYSLVCVELLQKKHPTENTVPKYLKRLTNSYWIP